MLTRLSAWTVPCVVLLILGVAAVRRVPVFAAFTDGARDGARAALRIFPSLVGLITAVTMLRASGLLDLLAEALAPATSRLGLPSELVPLVLLRPVSGSGSIAMLQSLFAQCGPDSRAGRIAAVMAGATETTFYTMTVYYGAVSVRRTRQTLPAAVVADVMCVLMAMLTVRWFFP